MTDRIEDAAASVRIDDGTITVTTDGEATVDADTPGCAPRSRRETALTLRVAGAEFEASVELDSDDVEALTDTLNTSQEAE
jgi:hypothetical protein